jgi:diguanylate cyclase (GGDEF)-like protein
MLDLDHFKSFNDTCGREAGDVVLRETGAFLVKNIRPEDFVCQFGGEEFVVILPTAAIDASRARARAVTIQIKGADGSAPGQVPGHDYSIDRGDSISH